MNNDSHSVASENTWMRKQTNIKRSAHVSHENNNNVSQNTHALKFV